MSVKTTENNTSNNTDKNSSQSTEFFEIGFIKKAHGIKGEVLAHFYESQASYLKKELTLQVDDSFYEVIRMKPHKLDTILTLKGVIDRNASELLKGKKIFINSNLADKINKTGELFLGSILGYTLYNFQKEMGVVDSLTKTKAHDLVCVRLNHSDNIVELPWVDEFIVSVDHDSSAVYFEGPEELFDFEFFGGVSQK